MKMPPKKILAYYLYRRKGLLVSIHALRYAHSWYTSHTCLDSGDVKVEGMTCSHSELVQIWELKSRKLVERVRNYLYTKILV